VWISLNGFEGVNKRRQRPGRKGEGEETEAREQTYLAQGWRVNQKKNLVKKKKKEQPRLPCNWFYNFQLKGKFALGKSS